MAEPTDPSTSQRQRLESWKEIAAYLRRTVRTVQRWESEQGLPVHRLVHNRLPTVYAYADEIDEWWESRKATIEIMDPADEVEPPEPATPSRESRPPESRRSDWALAIGALIIVAIAASFIVTRQPSTNSQAEKPISTRDLIANGRAAWKKRTPAGFKEAQALFERAIAQEATNADAYSGLADTYTLLEAFGIAPRDETLAKALQAAQQAVKLAPQSGPAHASLSLVIWEQGDRDGGVREMHRAIELDPSYATAHHWYALYLQYLGRYQEAIEEGRRAWAFDSSSPVIGTDLSLMLRNAGRVDEAETLLKEVLSLHPQFPDVHFQLGEIYRTRAQYVPALEHVRHAIAFGDDRPPVVARLAWLENENGNPGEARRVARSLLAAQARGDQVARPALAEALMAAGDFDAAFGELKDALRRKEEWVTNVTTDPLYDALRRDGRWPALHRELIRFAKEMDLAPVTAPVPR